MYTITMKKTTWMARRKSFEGKRIEDNGDTLTLYTDDSTITVKAENVENITQTFTPKELKKLRRKEAEAQKVKDVEYEKVLRSLREELIKYISDNSEGLEAVIASITNNLVPSMMQQLNTINANFDILNENVKVMGEAITQGEETNIAMNADMLNGINELSDRINQYVNVKQAVKFTGEGAGPFIEPYEVKEKPIELPPEYAEKINQATSQSKTKIHEGGFVMPGDFSDRDLGN